MEPGSSSMPPTRSNNTTPHHHYYSSAEPTNYLSPPNANNNYSPSSNASGDHRATGSHTHHMYASPVISGSLISQQQSQNPNPSCGGVENGGFAHSHESYMPSGYIHGHHHHAYYNESHNLNHSSNSNTTVSCGSGNSTSANIGIGSISNNVSNNLNISATNNNSIVFPDTKINTTREIRTKEQQSDILEKKNKAFTIGNPNQEFLPICDALFNVISLAAYFCDIAFDILTAYTWYKTGISRSDSMQATDNEFIDFSLEPDGVSATVQTNYMQWSLLAIVSIVLSTLLSQTLSYKWYKESETRGQMGVDGSEIPGPPPPCSNSILIAMHFSFCGVLWRYFKLFIPVDLRFVKNEVRDLCLLRLVHAFCEAAPMLLMQLYLIWLEPGSEYVTDFTIVSTTLSLFSVCWAFASFTKNIRKQNVHKLVLTWLGVICQFLWRLGTVTSRVVALSVYATVYSYWVFLVLTLHWFSMLMWLISPKNIFHGEKMSSARKTGYATLIAVVYTFCYINVQEHNSKDVIMTYYVTMFLENSLLLAVSIIALNGAEVWFLQLSTCLVFIPFAIGILFMCIYYRYCHVKRLSYVYDSSTSSNRDSENPCSTLSLGASPQHSSLEHSSGSLSPSSSSNNGGGLSSGSSSERGPKCFEGRVMRGKLGMGNSGKEVPLVRRRDEKFKRKSNGALPAEMNQRRGGDTKNGTRSTQLYNDMNGHHIHHPANVPGVFNCRFNPALKRKKKKPTSFIPPPVIRSKSGDDDESEEPNTFENRKSGFPSSSLPSSSNNIGSPSQQQPNDAKTNGQVYYGVSKVATKMANPFWKRPLSITLGSETEGSVGSRVDIQQKLQEKKQQQLQELRVIEEEIKQGKLKRPLMSDISEPISVQQPIPCEKKQPWFQAEASSSSVNPHEMQHRPSFMVPPNDLNELLLDPQYLVYSSIGQVNGGNPTGPAFYASPEWPVNYYNEPVYQNDLNEDSQAPYEDDDNEDDFYVSRNPNGDVNSSARESSMYKSYRMHSDIDSQMSLPRSYTLPSQFKRKPRKVVKTEHFLPSTNSSDGMYKEFCLRFVSHHSCHLTNRCN